jgi:hypothetical protein
MQADEVKASYLYGLQRAKWIKEKIVTGFKKQKEGPLNYQRHSIQYRTYKNNESYKGC